MSSEPSWPDRSANGGTRPARSSPSSSLVCPFALLLPVTTPGAGLLFFVAATLVVNGLVVVSNVIIDRFRQTYVPAGMLGRVAACVTTVSCCSMPAGALIAGGLGQTIGVRNTLCVLTAGASGRMYLASSVRQIRRIPDAPIRVPGSSPTAANHP